MKKTKAQKGITLIALIITIVVLMVLAAVAISSIQNDGIIGHAENATNKFTEEQQKEQDMLNYYELVLSGKAWTQNKTTVSRGTDTFKVGEKVKLKATGDTTAVAYSAGDYSGDWVVLGAENGKLLLVSAGNVVSSVTLGGASGYYNGVEDLNTVCSSYLNTKYADSARSITAEDINRVTGFKPESYTGYGTTYTITQESVGVFMHPDGREIGKNGVTSIQETSTSYSYSGSTYFATTDPEYVALFSNTNFGSGSYWLASPFVEALSNRAYFGLRVVSGGSVNSYHLWGSEYGGDNYSQYGARAVVSINPDIEVEKAA